MLTKKFIRLSKKTNKGKNKEKTQKTQNTQKIKKTQNTLLLEFIKQNIESLKKGTIVKNETLDNVIFKSSSSKCICENILKEHLDSHCSCDSMKTYSSQGRSKSVIHSIKCNKNDNILKINKISNYYMKLRDITNKYLFFEFDLHP